MAPIEVEYGTYWNDGETWGFTNSKTELPVVVKKGKRIRKTFKEGKLKLTLDISCDKLDRGGSVSYEFRYTRPGDEPFIERVNRGTDAISPGGEASRVIREHFAPEAGFRAVHIGEIAESIAKEI